jgi:hypothetical protein
VSDTLCGLVVCVPAPLKVCLSEASEALLTKEMLPVEFPVVGGVNVTVYCALWPAATLRGKLTPLTEYPDPLQPADATVTSAVEADKVPVSDELPPTATFPKLSVEGDTANAPVVGGGGGWVLDPAETPAHPARRSRDASATRAPIRRDRELCVLSIHTIIRLEPDGVERAKSHDRWRELNCTLVMQMAIIKALPRY